MKLASLFAWYALAAVGAGFGMTLGGPACFANSEPQEVALFDGKTLNGWRGYKTEEIPAAWTVVDGQIKGTGKGTDLMTVETFDHFELSFEWKLAEAGNSGVLYHVTTEGEAAYHTGPEYQLIDDDHFKETLAPVHSAAAIYGLYGTIDKTLNQAGEYNSARIVVVGRRIEHWLNGELVSHCELDSDDWKTKLAASKFHEWPMFAKRRSGHIVLQAHGSDVWFRNLKLRRLQPPEPEADAEAESPSEESGNDPPSDATDAANAAGSVNP